MTTALKISQKSEAGAGDDVDKFCSMWSDTEAVVDNELEVLVFIQTANV